MLDKRGKDGGLERERKRSGQRERKRERRRAKQINSACSIKRANLK